MSPKNNNRTKPSPPIPLPQLPATQLQLLLQHPQALHLQLIDMMAQSMLAPAQILRYLALAAYLHPVMTKNVQSWMVSVLDSSLWEIDENLNIQLEVLNIAALTPHLDHRVLNIKKAPKTRPNSYQQALWVNALLTLTPSFSQQLQTKSTNLPNEPVLQVRSLFNKLSNIKEEVNNKVYDLQKETEEALIVKNKHYHELDVELSRFGLLTLSYLPNDYDSSLIQVWLDRTVELNGLLGNFVCKQRFGQFQYIRGPLSYAMEQGITLLLLNFGQISSQLLVSLVSLAREGTITHNQITVRAAAGFKMLGILTGQKGSKSRANIGRLVKHIDLPAKNLALPTITNQTNRQLIYSIFEDNSKQLGYLGSCKLWKRIERLRKKIINISQEDNLSQQEKTNKLWNSFFTQQFIDDLRLQLADLLNKATPNRLITYQQKYKQIVIGRTEVSCLSPASMKIVKTQYSLGVLEKLSICFELGEPPLLISQTGCGKTTLVQYLSQLGGHRLYVYNMSSGTDVTDLVGGFKPVDCRLLLKELFYQFCDKFRNEVPGAEKNQGYLTNLTNYYLQGRLQILLKSLVQSIPKIMEQITQKGQLYDWKDMLKRFSSILQNLDKIDSNLVFSFLQGNLIKALKNGDWILVDEINLATNDVLQKIVPLIQGKSLMLYEKGDLHFIERHPDFRIVACMNPANDSGKKALPPNLAQQFTSIVMSEPSSTDIQMMVRELCPQLNPLQIAELYFDIKKVKTVSLRNLSRAMAYINRNKETYGWNRSVYDGLMLGFGSKDALKKYHTEAVPKESQKTVEISGFLLQKGTYQDKTTQMFHLTDTFKEHLKDLLRAIAGTELPVLLQGPTSAGKTSMIRYVAERVGYKCIRINNHEHTQIEQYIGNYFPDRNGKLVFREGPLVQAVREGHWLILDELNLAKTQILECLNRLLDDNRELFIPEQQKHIKPHHNFRIFATQNPASYSGRKTLSRAFRNRFVSISFADINTQDTMAILEARSPLLKDSKQLSMFVKKTLQTLANYRQRQRVFEKEGLITIRNLLKWCERPFVDKEKFILQGYAILGQKLRSQQQKKFVEKSLFSGSKLTLTQVREQYLSVVQRQFSQQKIAQTNIYVQMNDSFKRMAALTVKAINNRQPVLLVGETGCGKTTLAQLLAALTGRPYFSINCHKHMEASDLLGSLRPSPKATSGMQFEFINGVVIDAMLQGGILLIDEINTAEDSVLERLNQVLQSGVVGIERGQGWETVEAAEGFCIIGTMNPSGDYGKKQLSPALRNRFTQIWVEPITHPEYLTAAKDDISTMISHKLTLQSPQKSLLSTCIFNFLQHYNCQVAPRHNLTRKLLTMRDIGWMCKFINQSRFESWQEKYFWSVIILAVEGVRYIMTDSVEGGKLSAMRDELMKYLKEQISVEEEWIRQAKPEYLVSLLKDMSFPLLIKTDVPIEVLGIKPHSEIFFSPQTDLSDLLGQYRPQGNDFVWHDQPLLRCVKEGGIVALVDLNMAQQQVVEGVNSLFDHRGSLFVVELNQTFYKADTFQGVVVLRKEGGNGRKGLANSFLNRFVKIYVPEVATDLQLNYLTNKYSSIKNNFQAIHLLTRLLTQKNLIIEQLEFIVQMMRVGLLGQALQILNLIEYQNQEIPSSFSSVQKDLLSYFPLKRSFGICNSALVKLAISVFMIYKYTSFSVCLIGNSQLRSSIVKSLAYLTRKNIAPILISTMLDINDLLGTYEQVAVDQSMRPQTTLFEDIFAKEKKADYQSEQTKFVFVESKIVKCLKNQNNLVYVEVPNETIAERIQKGLTEVYNHKKKIVMGTDNLTKKTSIAKFITIDLDQIPTDSTVNESTWEYFPSNESKLEHLDISLRRKEAQEMILELMNQQNDRGSVGAWRRVVAAISEVDIEERNREEVREKIEQQFYSKYNLKYVEDQQSERRIQTILNHVETVSTKEEFLRRVSLYSFFTGSSDQLNKYLSMLGGQEQSLRESIRKFQVLFICNINNFQTNALTLLPLILKSSELSSKYFKEIDRMYEELFKHKIKEILIQFNEEEYKTVPIISNQQAVRYLMSGQSQDLRAICGQGVRVDLVTKGVQKYVLGQIRMLEISIENVSQWSRHAKIKHLPMLSILHKNINKKQQLFSNPLQDKQVQNFLRHLSIDTSQLSLSQQALSLWNHFKPNNNMSVNISYHLRNQLNLKYYSQLVNQNKTYMCKYSHFAFIKYSGYLPKELEKISAQIEHCQEEMLKIGKLLVYRGHDNILSLIDFYVRLSEWTSKVEKANFDPAVIKQVISQTYHVYYHTYSDILLPYYLALLSIHYHSHMTSPDRTSSISDMIRQHKPQPIKLIQGLLQQEEGEVDRSKDYLRFQKKFNRTVIVDEYTEQGMAKNKQNLEDEFAELFGGSDRVKVQSPFEQIYMLICKNGEQYYHYLAQTVLNHTKSYEELVCGLSLLQKYEQPNVNIYEEYNPYLVQELVAPLPAILEDIHRLLALYPMDNIKNLANLCNKIQQRAISEQVYKILIDCEFLIEKIFEVNPILPSAQHINTQAIIQNCLKVRKLQLKNWKKMIDFKVRRTQQSDMLQFLHFYRNIKSVQNQKQVFGLCEQYLRESKISCLPLRNHLLLFMVREGVIPAHYIHSLYRVVGFFDYLSPDITYLVSRVRKQKEKQMREYEKLAGWNSNQYLIFKATCEKFQRKIHHILKRYDEELSMTVGTYHQQVLARQFFNSVKEFSSGITTLVQNKALPEPQKGKKQDQENQQISQKEESQDEKAMDIEEVEQLAVKNQYEDINNRIFQSLAQLQQEHHNTQSKLLIIRGHLQDLQVTFKHLTFSSKVQFKYLTPQMFPNEQDCKRAMKYYYGLWDKLCQRSQSKWYQELTDRLWDVIDKVWVKVNQQIKYGNIVFPDEKAQDMKVLLEQFIKRDNGQYHSLFRQQLTNINSYLQQIQQKEVIRPDPQLLLSTNTVSLMKLGYILANIAVNIEKNGLCVKQQTEENQQSGSEQIGEGMGIGQGEAHDAAQNVGDEIEFQEQIMGHKDQEKNEDKNANNKEQNDIEMQNDFDGQMYSKEEQAQGSQGQEGQSKEADEKMGDVDEKQKQKDMKNEAGEAEGSEEADVDVKNQKEGDEQLVDNQRQDKEQRKGEEKRDISQEDPEERSDWDDNNEEGQKINKQKEDVEAQEEESSFEMNQNQKPEEIEEEGAVSEGEEQEKQGENKQENEGDEGQQEEMEDQNQNGIDRQGEDIDPEAEPEQDQEKQQRKPRQQQNPKKYNPAYGRRDLNTNNEVINDQENPANEMGDEGNEAQGEQEGNQGSGNPVHNLSPEFIEEVLKQHKSEGNQKFIRDLNVLMHDQKEQAAEADQENAQQYELTQEKDKNATNLPMMDDQKMKQQQEQLLQGKQQKDDKRNTEENLNKQKKDQAENDKKDKQKLSKQQKKNQQKNANDDNALAAEKYQMDKKAQNMPKKEQKYEKEKIEGDDEKQQLVKNALSSIKNQIKIESDNQKQNGQQILSEAHDVSKILEEQLKSVLEPMDNAEYRGDFKTGKKLNLKKIIPFIASNFRKDRIWLRRTQPSERNYYIMLALDDTKSMHYGNVGTEALKGLLAISMALEHLSIKTSVCSIRDEMVTLKGFKDILNSQSILNNFQFQYESSNSHDLSMAAFMDSSIQTFKKVESDDINVQCRKLCFIISDGKMNKKLVAPFMKSAKKEDITYIFIIVDSQQSSIMNIKTVQYIEKKMKIKNYMADFPFEYFLIINDVKQLGQILAMTLLQFIQEK